MALTGRHVFTLEKCEGLYLHVNWARLPANSMRPAHGVT